MTTKEKLLHIMEMRNPQLRTNRLMAEALSGIKTSRGKDGYTPIRGVDYFTEEEINALIEMIQANVFDGLDGDPGPQGDPGYTPVKGKDYFTAKEIESFKNSVTPIKGTDYFTKKEIEAFKKAITPVKGKDYFDGESPSIADIVKEVKKTPVDYKDIQGVPDEFNSIPALVKFLKMGGFRGGQGSVTGTVAIVYTVTPTGAIDGVNKTYTVPNAITNVYSFAINGQFLHPTSDYTFTGTTITMVTALPASLSGLPFTIIYS